MVDTDPNVRVWDNYWKTENPVYGSHKVMLEYIRKHVPSQDSIIMEIGVGSGVDAIEIANAGHTVIALDISRESLKLMKSNARGKPIELIPVIGDALNLPFKDNSLDFIYHQGVMEHFKNPLPFLAQHKKALKNGGKMLVDVPQTFTIYTFKKKWAMAKNKWFAGWETQYTPVGLRMILNKTGLKVIEIYGRDFDFIPFIWLSNIERLGENRFGRPIFPRFISKPIGLAWRLFERSAISQYFKHCIGAIAQKGEDVI